MMQITQITTERCKERLVKALAEKVGFKKEWSGEAFADASGIEKSTLNNYLSGESLPTLPKFLRMCALLGPGFANRFLQMAGLGGAERMIVQPVTHNEMNGELAQTIGALGAALADGRVDHTELPIIVREVRDLIPVLQDWLAANDRPSGEAVPVADEEFLTMRNDLGSFDA